MAQNIFVTDNPYVEKIMRRVVPVFSVAVIIFAFSGIRAVIASDRAFLEDEHQIGLERLENFLEDDLRALRDDVSNAVDERDLRAFLNESNQITYRLATERAEALIEAHPETYQAVRYISRDGLLQLEVINRNGIAQATPLGDLNQISDFTATRTFEELRNDNIQQIAVGDFRLRPDTTDTLLSVIAPVTAVNAGTVQGFVELEIAADRLLGHVNLALSDDEQVVRDQAGRRLLLLDARGRVIADSGAIGDNYIRNLEATGGNTIGDDFYEDVLAYAAGSTTDVLTDWRAGAGQIYSKFYLGDRGQFADVYGIGWQLVIIDNPLLYYASTVSVVTFIGALATLVTVVGVFLIRRLITPMLIPVAEAESVLQVVSVADDRPSLLRRPESSASQGEMVKAVNTLTRRIEDLTTQLDTEVSRRNRDLQVAGRIGRETAVQRDLDTLVRRAINLICNELGFYHAQVFLVDESGLNAVLRYSRGEAGAQLLERGHSLTVGSDTVIGTVTGDGRALIVNNMLGEAGDRHGFDPLLPDTRAEMGLPLFIGEDIIGALDIQSRTVDAFDEDDLPTYQLVADQLAIAIYNGQLREQSERRIRQIDRLNSQLTRDAWQELEQRANIEGRYGADVTGKLKAPITIRGQVIGELEADLPDDQDFSQGDQQILQSVAERVALALDNARLFQETQTTLAETSTLYQLSRLLNEANTLEDVLQSIIITVASDAAGGQVWLFEETLPNQKSDWVRLAVDLALIERPDERDIVGERLQLSKYRFFDRLRPDDITIIEDTTQVSITSSRLLQLMSSMNARSIVFIPLTIRGAWKGFISVEFATTHVYTEKERRVYNALIAQAGVAVDNRLLLQTTEDALVRQEKLYASSRIINTARVLPDLIYAAVATTSDSGIDFWLGLLEGDLHDADDDWSARAHIVAKSDERAVVEVDEYHQVFLPQDSPMYDREPQLIRDTDPQTDDVSALVRWLRSLGYRFMATFPLFSDNEMIALFYIVSKEDYELSGDDYEVYRSLTGQMSTQIQNRRLLEQTEQALSEARRLYVATSAITGASETAAIYETVASHLALPFIQQERSDLRMSITILLAQPTPSVNAPQLRYDYQWLSEPAGAPDVPIGTVISQEDAPFGQMLESSEEPVLVYRDIDDDLQTDFPMIRDILAQNGATSAVAVAFWAGQRWYGTMIVRSDAPAMMSDSYVRFVQSIAGQVAIAIENQNLLEENVRERERLNTILSTLPTGVLVLDPETFEPIQHNQRLEELLGREVAYEQAFTTSRYNMYRTGTNIYYPDEEFAIYQAQQLDRPMMGDDIAVFHEVGQTDLLVTAAPIYEADGSQRAVVAAFQDISTLRSMENTMQENLRETVLLYETQRALSQSESLDELLDNMIGQLAVQQPADAYILLSERDGFGNQSVSLARSLVQDLTDPRDLQAILTPDVLNINDVERATEMDADARQALVDVGARSVLVLPLASKTRAQVLGWMVLVDSEPEAFVADQQRTMTSVADMASTAIDNQFLVESTQEALTDTANLYNAATAISRSRDIMTLFLSIQGAIQTLAPDMYAGLVVDNGEMLTHFKDGFDDAEANGLDLAKLFDYNVPQDGIFVTDIHNEDLGDFAQAMIAGGEIQAFAAVSLRVKDVPRGLILLGFSQPHFFDEGERRYLNTIADSASVIIDNQQLLDQIQTTLQETTVLYQASKALLETNQPTDIIDVIVNHLIEPHINQVFIALLNKASWDASGAAVEVVASWQLDSDVDLLGVTLSPEQFPAWTQLATDTAVLAIEDIYDEQYDLDPLEQTSIASLDTRSLVVIPLRVPSRAIGAIWLGSRETHTYSDADMRIFQTFAEQTSLSLEAQRLLQETNQRAAQLETSSAISQSVSQILDLDVLLPQVVDLIREQFGYDQVQIFLMDDEREWALLQASTGEPGEKLLAIGHKLQRASESVIGQVTELGIPTIALDTADANVVHQPNPYLPLTRSELALPLTVKGEVVGALDVQSNQPNAFSDEDVRALESLSNQIAVAIENARLYEDAERSAEEMSFLFDITTAAAAADTLESALGHVAQSVRDTFNAETVAIYLPREYEDYNQNQKFLMEIEALATTGTATPDSLSSIDLDDATNMVGVAASSRQSQLIRSIYNEDRYQTLNNRTRSAALVPITSGATLVGLIVVESGRVGAFVQETLTLFQTLAGSIAAIIQNSQLLEQLQETNQRLIEVDRLKSQFLASMSHELRTPLNSIIGFSRVMLKGIDGPLTEMQEQDLNTIFNSGNHLLNLINDILDQAKIEANELNLKFAFFDIKPMIESVRSIAIGMLKEKPLDFQVDIAPNMPQAFGDEFRSRQILLNLVSNAIKFTPEGDVRIQAYATPDDATGEPVVRIDVTDSGIGISEADMPILFEQFRQVDSSLTRTVGGTGLGLPISKALAELQGGNLFVESEVDVGSTFSVVIPTAPGAEEEYDSPQEETGKKPKTSPDPLKDTSSGLIKKSDVEKAKQMAVHNGDDAHDDNDTQPQTNKPKRESPMRQVLNEQRLALLIEDNKEIVDRFRRTLQREGFEVTTADLAPYAEAMASQLRPNLILLDVNFAEGKGWDILKNLKERDDTFDIPVIVTTMDDDSERAYRLGAYHFMQRPVLPDELLAVVTEAEQESRRERILIIDDQPDAIRLLKQLLDEHGDFRVFSAESGDEGISLVARRRPDLIILDLRMPEKDGFAVLDELRDNPETANIPVLVVTGELDFNASEQEALENIRVVPKADINQEEYDQFITNVRAYLESKNG